MYDNSTPIGGQTSSARGNLINSSKSNPCPVCGRTKDGDCRISRDGRLVLCHQNFNYTKTKQPDLWHFNGETSDGRCGEYLLKEITEKSIRPKAFRTWEYPARDGSKLVRVCREDDGEGNKKVWQERWDKDKKQWLRGLGQDKDANKVARASIPIYRYTEVREAIAKGEPIHTVEGEPCADLFWKLGLAATTNIGGSGKFTLTDSMDLQGAELIVIVPDRDKKGIEHAEKVAEHFPDALWLYPFPKSKLWENLADDHGLDVADWIEHEKLSASELRAAIGEKKVFEVPRQAQKVVSHPKFEAPNLSDLAAKIDELLDSDLKRSQLQIKVSELAQTYRLAPAEVWKIYRTREEELEQESERPDVATEIENLLSAHKSSIALTEVLPVGLAQPIEKLAAMLNLRSECYLAALLTQVSSLFKVGTETMLRRDTDWRCVPNYFAGVVAEVSQLKTPIPKAIIDRPMRALRQRAQKEFEQAQANYETELNNWKAVPKKDDRGPAPKPPRQRIYMFDKTTGEGIIYQQAEFPEQAMMYFCDELAGMLKSPNQYRGGKGSDEEDMLSFWNGTGTTVLRAAGVRASVEAVGLSIFGTIQPDVLASLLKDCSDSNGKFARFDFVFQPLAVPNLPEDDSGHFDLTPMLADLYQKIDALPAIYFEFDREAKEYHRTFTLACHRLRIAEPKQGLRGALGKMPEKVGKLATTIHALTCIFNGQQVTNQIPRSAVEAAVRFVKFAADQVASLYTEFSDRSALAPNLTKILLAAERQGGKISTREAQHVFQKKDRPTAQTIREWFADLQEMKYGEITTVKKSVFLTLTTTTVTTVTSNTDTERANPNHSTSKTPTTVTTVNDITVVNCGSTVVGGKPQLEPLPDKALDTTVVTVVANSPPSQKSKSLLLSSQPSQPVKSAATPKAPKTFEIGDRVVVKDVGGIYQGARGEVVDNIYSRAGTSYLVRFDKRVRNAQQAEFEASDLMKL